jgi:glycosyltransferase involved in cell wall biosynthesis
VRVAFYTHPAFLESALHLSRALSPLVDLHVLIEVSPWTWRLAGFDVPPLDLPAGVSSAKEVFQTYLPRYWNDFLARAAGVYFAVHREPRSLTPATWLVTQHTLKFLRTLRPDILHVDDADESLRLAIGFPWRLAAPVVLSVHDPEEHSGEANWRNTLARRLLFRHAREFVLHNAAAVPSFCTRHNVPPRRVHAIPLGVLETPGRSQMSEEALSAAPTVLFFGRLSPYKGLDTLYEAAPIVAEHVPGVRFIVAGRPIRGFQPPDAPTLPRSGQVEVFAEYIHNDRARALFEAAHVVVCPYVDATQSAVILTAYGFDKPVVATRVGGIPEYVSDGESGLLVRPRDAQGLADAVIAALTDASLRARFRVGIATLAHGPLSWSTIAGNLMDVYRRAIDASADSLEARAVPD